MLRSLLAAAAFALVLPPASAQTCTTEWAAAASGVWSADANWTAGAPDAADVACITTPGVYVVTLDRRQALAGLVVGGASGLQTLVVAGTLAPLGSGTVGPNGRVEIENSENCGSCDGLPAVTGTLAVAGTLVHREGVGLLSGGGTLDVAAGGLLRVRTGFNSAGLGSGTAGARSRLVVRGRLLFDTEGQTPRSMTVSGDVDLAGGTVAVTDGTVGFSAQGRWTGGAFEVAEGAVLSFRGGNGSDGVYETSGTFSGASAGVVQFTGGSTLAAAPGGATLALGGAGLQVVPGSGQATFFTSTGGGFTNTGRVSVQGNGLWVRGASLRNEGDLEVRSTLRMGEGAEIDNAASGAVILLDGGSINGGSDGGALRSVGRLAARLDTRSSARSSVLVPVDLEGAPVEVAADVRLQLSQGTFRDVAFEVGASGQVLLTTANSGGLSGVFVAEGTLRGDLEGAITVTNAEVQAGPAGVTFDVGGAGLELRAGSGGYAILSSAGGDIVNRGVLSVDFNGPEVRGVHLRNEGRFTSLNPSITLSEGAVVENAVGATVELQAGAGFRAGGGGAGTFVNEGLVVKAGGGSTAFQNTLRSRPGSELRVLSGQVSFIGEDPTHYGEGVRLTGGGEGASVFMSPPQAMQGTVSPGIPDDPMVDFSFSSHFRLDDAAGDARLVIDVGPGGESDAIRTNHTILLGGTLVVRVQAGYVPAFGDAFTIVRDLRNNAVQGGFSAVEVEGAPEGVSFAVDTSSPGAVVLRAVAAVAVRAPVASTPEGTPAAFVLTHPAAAEPFSIPFDLGGTATPFADYTLSATRGVVRTLPNTTRTVVTLYPRRDADTGEGPEAVTLTLRLGADAAPVDGAGSAGIAIEDGPSSEALAVSAVTPARGANGGTVTPTILGQGLADDAQIRLIGPATVVGEDLAVAPTGTGAQATFDLRGAPVGTYAVEVTSGGQASTLPAAFTVEAAVPAVPVWASIAGTPAPRSGRFSTYTLTVGNDGPVDLYDTFVLLRLTAGVEYEVRGVAIPSDLPAGAEDYVGIDVGDVIAVPLYLYHLPAGASREVVVRIKPVAPLGIGDGAGVSYELYPPNPLATFTYTGDFDDFDADLAADRPTNWGVIGGALALALSEAEGRTAQEAAAAALARLLPRGPNNPWDRDDFDRGANPSDLQDLYGGLGAYDQYRGEVELNNLNPWGELVAWGLGTFVVGAAVVAGTITIGTAAIIAGGVLAVASIVSAGNSAERVRCSRSRDGCGPPGGGGAGGSTGGPGGGPGGGLGGGAGGKIGGSFDPNDKLGPAGEGGLRYYDPATVATPYTIRFENVETATFPAQEVVVVDTLDAAVFDLSTFALGPIRYGAEGRLVPPPGAQQYEAEVALPDLGATLLVTAALDVASGRAVWRFATLDPATGDLPEDGRIGFLPPNATAPEGEGSVSFTVAAREGLATGTTVRNQAEITFDVNAPIVTPEWVNTVDTAPPTTRVDALPEASAGPLTLTVSGADVGVGVQVYALYASRDGGPFELVAESTEPSFAFEGAAGSTYGFYSIGMDFVTNTEPPKTDPEATTAIAVDAVGGPSVPEALSVGAARPNPTRGAAAVQVGVPAAGPVRVAVYDALGREVAVLLDGERPAGWYPLRWEGSAAAGVYVVRVVAGGQAATRTLTVLR